MYEYDLKDHLGNTRVTLTPDPNDNSQQTAKLLQENDYYAFGYGIQSMQQTISPKNEYLYNHKELQEETGLYDYGARFYDPVIARWGSVDPLAEKGRRWSPYVYGFDNPIRFEDPDGMWPDWRAWADNIKQGFVNHYQSIKQVLTTNPVTTAKRIINDAAKHPGETLANAATNGLYGKVKESYVLTKAVVTDDAKTGGPILGNAGAGLLDAAVTTGVAGGVAKGLTALRGVATEIPSASALSQNLAAELNAAGGRTPTMAAAAVDRTTGATATAVSGRPYADFVEPLASQAPVPSLEPWLPCNCAEPKAVNTLVKAGSDINNIDYSTTRISTGESVPPCANCKVTLKGATHKP